MSLWLKCPEALWTERPSPPPALINHYGTEPHLSSWSETSNERRDHDSTQPQKYFIKSTFKHTTDHIGEAPHPLPVSHLNDKWQAQDHKQYVRSTHCLSRDAANSVFWSDLAHAGFPPRSARVISWILMAPPGPCDLCSCALLRTASHRRAHT